MIRESSDESKDGAGPGGKGAGPAAAQVNPEDLYVMIGDVKSYAILAKVYDAAAMVRPREREGF